jgi:flavin reductase (DIM6/NTAB) family NADH-FMN oxidoreductase RutF
MLMIIDLSDGKNTKNAHKSKHYCKNDVANLNLFGRGRFVLNVLREGRNLRRHFSANAEGDALDKLSTHPAQNGCLILDEALSYLECTVKNRIEAGDRWLVYATIDRGELLDRDGVTAIHYRKAASQ